MLPARIFVALAVLAAAVSAATPREAVHKVKKDGKEYIIGRENTSGT